MKKFFDEPVVECIRLTTESITDNELGSGNIGAGTVPGNGPLDD